jgi:hypothetical protein
MKMLEGMIDDSFVAEVMGSIETSGIPLKDSLD